MEGVKVFVGAEWTEGGVRFTCDGRTVMLPYDLINEGVNSGKYGSADEVIGRTFRIVAKGEYAPGSFLRDALGIGVRKQG